MATRKTWIDDPRWERAAALGGFVFAVLATIWALLAAGAPKMDASTNDITSYYDDHGHRVKIGIATLLLTLAALFLIWFLGSLRTALRRAEGGDARVTGVVFGAGVALAAVVLVQASVYAAPAEARQHGGTGFQLDPDTVRVIGGATWWLIAQEAALAGLLTAAISMVILRTAVFPIWFGWVGLVVALFNLLSIFLAGVALPLFLAWLLVLSLFVWRPGAAAEIQIPPAA